MENKMNEKLKKIFTKIGAFFAAIFGAFITGFITRKVLQDNRTADDRVRTDIGKLQDVGTELHNNNERFEGLLSEIRENNKS